MDHKAQLIHRGILTDEDHQVAQTRKERLVQDQQNLLNSKEDMDEAVVLHNRRRDELAAGVGIVCLGIMLLCKLNENVGIKSIFMI